MAAKIIKKKKEGEDFLGLITLGSLIVNLFQHESKKSLVEQHNALKAHYEIMLQRYQQIYNAYMSMKRVNEGLTQEVRTLNTIISELRKENNRLLEENLKLKGVRTEGPIRRRRRISSSRKIV